MSSRFGAALLLGAVLLACVGCKKPLVPVPAQPLPSQDLFSKEQIKEGFFNYSVTPLKRIDLHFSMLVPKTWREEPVEVSKGEVASDDVDFVTMARFVPEASPESAAIEVSYLRLRLEMDLGDYVDSYLEGHAINVIARQKATFNVDTVEDVFAVVPGDQPFFTRFTFRKDGPHIVLVNSSAIPEEWEKWAKHFGAAAVSLRLLPGSDELYAEKVTILEANKDLGLKLRVLASWDARSLEGAPEGYGGVDLTLHNGEMIRAVLRVKWIDKSKVPTASADQMGEKAWQEFLQAGVEDAEFLGTGQVPNAGPSPNGEVGLWTGRLAESKVLLRAVAFEGDRAVYSVALLGPARQFDQEGWATAAKAFEFATKDVAGTL